MCFLNEDVSLMDSLSRPLSLETVDSSLWSDKCDYWTMESCENLNPANYNLVVLQWNIRSMMFNSKELRLLLDKMDNRNSPTDVILICETFLNKDTTKLINIPRYTLHTNYRNEHKGGGMAVLIRNGITHKRRKDLEVMIKCEAESTYVEVTAKNGKHIIFGSIYRLPNTCADKMKDHITKTVQIVKGEKGKKELVMGMDHNLDLLKGHEHQQTQAFLDLMLELGLIPTIT